MPVCKVIELVMQVDPEIDRKVVRNGSDGEHGERLKETEGLRHLVEQNVGAVSQR